jgi:UDP-N-acetylglucosamine--N-acetylmuramyl-(pentapeptide) pyrophosphoryl-undecaprenol N-acetylglucosamine transferase
MDDTRTYRVLIGGGGTGGHVFPAIAIADAVKKMHPATEFLFVGAKGKLEMEKVPEAGYEIEGLTVAGFRRSITLKNFTFFYKLLVSMIQSRRIVRTFKPDVAVGVGGYASGPILKAAARKGVPILIQEQNSYAGVTNRLLSRAASVICVAYEEMEKYFPKEKILLTGNPVRRRLLEFSGDRAQGLKEFGLRDGTQICLVVGGSLGARTINHSIMDGLDRLNRRDIQLLWQCGTYYIQEAREAVTNSGVGNVRVEPFISKMEWAYQIADVIVSRAGAITISELCLAGKPAILVPSPNVAEDHQTRNAAALVERKAALMVPDRQAPDKLVDTMLQLLEDRKQQQQLSKHMKKLGISDASERIASEVLKLVN